MITKLRSVRVSGPDRSEQLLCGLKIVCLGGHLACQENPLRPGGMVLKLLERLSGFFLLAGMVIGPGKGCERLGPLPHLVGDRSEQPRRLRVVFQLFLDHSQEQNTCRVIRLGLQNSVQVLLSWLEPT